ncbi:type IV pilus biogenesis protein PilI [Cellvibrio sp. OA-2007]|uniref:type IV pilus biogenesis protein PilI n=1 Tax=Cellvibrio sp. OA-2007 TaxID=529823 RepID=UPI000785DF89|nr:hypothetical protein [Cellvibrio sp. OA-2007]
MTDIFREIIKVQVRNNNGDDVFFTPSTILEALKIAKSERNPDNYMVCIAIDNERTHRWDREFAINKKSWRKREPDAREPKGVLPSVYRVHERFMAIGSRPEDLAVGIEHRA